MTRIPGPGRRPAALRTARRRPVAAAGDAGSAMVEFTVLAVLLMVPLAYLVLTVFTVQRAAYAVTAAAREAGRAYATAETGDVAEARARTAAAVSLADHGLRVEDVALSVGCADAGSCFDPGDRIAVSLDADVPLPFLPRVLAGRAPASIGVDARHVEIVDLFKGGG